MDQTYTITEPQSSLLSAKLSFPVKYFYSVPTCAHLSIPSECAISSTLGFFPLMFFCYLVFVVVMIQ